MRCFVKGFKRFFALSESWDKLFQLYDFVYTAPIMKNFDDFSRKKKPDPSLASEGLSVKDDGKPIHRDIEKKRKQVSLISKNSLTHAKHTKSRDTKEHMSDWMLSVQAFFAGMTLLQMCMILCVCFLGFIVYGLGFIVRTENNIRTWVSQSRSDIIGQM